MKVIVVEDEQLAAQRLVEMICHSDIKADIVSEMDSVREVVDYFKSGNTADLIFLDIQLADGKSFEIFDQVKINLPIIFTTAYDQYALQAFQVLSIDYLLKPIQQNDIDKALNKVKQISKPSTSVLSDYEITMLKNLLRTSAQDYKTHLLIKSGNKLYYRSTDEVAYFFADGKAAYLVTKKDNRKNIIDYTLEELETLLDPKRFFRISRKFMIQIDSIAEINGLISTRLQIKLNQPCEHELAISRERVGDFKKWLDR